MSRCGIYWIDFENGESYVGQSVSAWSRLATHRRRWDDAVLVRFAECSPDRLDEFEFATFQLAQRSRPLWNKLLTFRPGRTSSRRRGLATPHAPTLPSILSWPFL